MHESTAGRIKRPPPPPKPPLKKPLGGGGCYLREFRDGAKGGGVGDAVEPVGPKPDAQEYGHWDELPEESYGGDRYGVLRVRWRGGL